MANSVSRRLILEECARRGWKTETIGERSFLLRIIAPDGRSELLHGTCPMRSSAVGSMIARYKDITLDFAKSVGYEVPASQLLATENDAYAFLSTHKTIVIKPLDGQRSEGVTVGISTEDQLAKAMAYALDHSPSGQILAQKHLEGKLYRVFILNGQLVAASWRRAASVIGDGQQSVRELAEALNRDPRRGPGVDTPLHTLNLAEVAEFVGEAVFNSVPTPGTQVMLSNIDSVSAGGEASNVTAQVHADWATACIKLTHAAQLFLAGFDIICDDISQPMEGNYWPLLEMNLMPGLKLHEYPTDGSEAIHLAPLLLDALFD